MKKQVSILLCLYLLCLTAGSSSKDKADFVGWMKNRNENNAPVSVWTTDDVENEQILTAEESQTFYTILHSLTKDDITENEHLAGITPEYGFHLVTDNQDYYINQADAPHGQFEIGYQNKQWWIECSDLEELYTAICHHNYASVQVTLEPITPVWSPE